MYQLNIPHTCIPKVPNKKKQIESNLQYLIQIQNTIK